MVRVNPFSTLYDRQHRAISLQISYTNQMDMWKRKRRKPKHDWDYSYFVGMTLIYPSSESLFLVYEKNH